MTTTPTSPAASQQAAVDAALLVLKSMGLSLDDLTAAPRSRPPVPTFAEYVPVVSATVTAGTLRAYGSYWKRIVEQWGDRRLDEPTPSEVKQLVALRQGERGAAPQQPGRAQRRREPDLRAALPVPARRGRRADRREGQPRPQGGQAPPPAVHPPGRGRHPAGGDQPGRRHHGRRPRTRHAHPAAAHRDRLPPRRRARAPSPGPGPRAVPDPAPGEGRDVPLAAGLPHPDGRRWCSTPRNGTPRRTGGCCATGTGARSPTAGTTSLWVRIGRELPWVRTQGISTHWLRHTTLTWVERNFGFAVAHAYAGHTDGRGDTGQRHVDVRARHAHRGRHRPGRADRRAAPARASRKGASMTALADFPVAQAGPRAYRDPAARSWSGSGPRTGPRRGPVRGGPGPGEDHAVLAAAGPRRPRRRRGVVRLGRDRAADRLRHGPPRCRASGPRSTWTQPSRCRSGSSATRPTRCAPGWPAGTRSATGPGGSPGGPRSARSRSAWPGRSRST